MALKNRKHGRARQATGARLTKAQVKAATDRAERRADQVSTAAAQETTEQLARRIDDVAADTTCAVAGLQAKVAELQEPAAPVRQRPRHRLRTALTVLGMLAAIAVVIVALSH
jgi:hypothetical protein